MSILFNYQSTSTNINCARDTIFLCILFNYKTSATSNYNSSISFTFLCILFNNKSSSIPNQYIIRKILIITFLSILFNNKSTTIANNEVCISYYTGFLSILFNNKFSSTSNIQTATRFLCILFYNKSSSRTYMQTKCISIRGIININISISYFKISWFVNIRKFLSILFNNKCISMKRTRRLSISINYKISTRANQNSVARCIVSRNCNITIRKSNRVSIVRNSIKIPTSCIVPFKVFYISIRIETKTRGNNNLIGSCALCVMNSPSKTTLSIN